MAVNRKETLLKLLKDPSPAVREAAAKGMNALEAHENFPALAAGLQSENAQERMRCVYALAALGNTAAVQALAEALHNPDNIVRAHAAELLGELGREETLPKLATSLRDPDPSVRVAIAGALGKFPKREVAKALIQAVTGVQDPEFQIAVVEALGNIGDFVAEKALVAFCNHPDERARAAAALALGKIDLNGGR